MENTTMTARYTEGKMTFTVNGKTIVTDNTIYCAYRSHINHVRCSVPDDWTCLNGVDEDGNLYTVWYQEGDDWKHPYDIENEYGDRIWTRSEM